MWVLEKVEVLLALDLQKDEPALEPPSEPPVRCTLVVEGSFVAECSRSYRDTSLRSISPSQSDKDKERERE